MKKNENLKRIEEIKISCAEEHFKLISNDKVKFFVTDSFENFKNKILSKS